MNILLYFDSVLVGHPPNKYSKCHKFLNTRCFLNFNIQDVLDATRQRNSRASGETLKKKFCIIPDKPFPDQDGWAGNVHILLWSYLRLRNSCKKAYMNITIDSDGDLTVSLKMVLAGQADQAPRRGGRQSSRHWE